MFHRRITSLTLASIILAWAAGIGAWAADQPAPVVLILPGTVGQAAAVSDSDVIEAVRTYLSGLGKVDVVAFDPENPTIARYIMERKLGEDGLRKIADPKTAKEIADLVHADYILNAFGEVRPDVARVALRLVKTSGKGEWTGSAESQIASGDGPQGALNRLNAINTAASAAVSDIDIAAFEKLKSKAGATIAEDSTIAPVVAPPVIESTPVRDLVAEYTAHINAAEMYVQRKDPLNAIYELRQAVDIEPKTVSTRLKLANAYSALGMTEEAADELQRTLLFRGDDPAINNALGEFYLSSGSLKQAADLFREAAKLAPANVDARVNLGNILWNQNKLDEAAAVFEEAAKIDPARAVPHERLYKLYWARKNYGPAIEHLVASKSGDGQLDAVARYKLAAGVVHAQLSDILGKLNGSWNEYQAQQINREDYYRECADLNARIGEFATFLSTQTAPDALRGAHAHGVFCASLLSQSANALTTYLETDKKQYIDESVLFREEAKNELEEFGKAIGE